ncbi:HAD family phosphatase [Aurantibacter crassamenti]|uniref:HAD family hydrolase n=1 Tax=Aurantibacter crassamenti TaxID=1837375 RepID=UPI00193A5C57|nr:HAD family hydrolase [Aurantibacter crassamenti]MBM1106630.1 HAD family phosphatase [Aurantibacter crassamenti]
MDLSKVKLVVTDMDGTLLNSNHEVSDRFFELYKGLKEKGILFVAASGRQYNSIVDKLEPIKNEIIIVAENGGFAMQNDIEIVSTPMSNNSKREILNLLDDVSNVHPVLCSKNNAFLSNASPEFVNKLKEYYTEYTLLDELKNHEGEIIKIAIYHFESSEKHIYPYVKHLEGDLKVKVSGENWVDISSPNANKGYTIDMIQKKYNISQAETMVFGDFNNDLEMLALADFSFAMENAHPNVKKAANYSTSNNDDFGVERILEKLLNA